MKTFLIFAFICSFSVVFAQKKEFDIKTIAFYNVENLFDTINNPLTFDDDRTPNGKYHYTSKVYHDKLDKVSSVLLQIGSEKANDSPALIGVCEVENDTVLRDLVSHKNLKNKHYEFIHKDSPDRRGIDVALLYRKQLFTPTGQNWHSLKIYDEEGLRQYTRDQLVVSGLLGGDLIYVIVNHWPSRRGGTSKSSHFRERAAKLNLKIIDSIRKETENAKIISMGDFNDDPTNKSIKKILNAKAKKKKVGENELYNPMAKMFKNGYNTLAFKDNLNLFDQIIISSAFLNKNYETYQFYKAGIYNKPFLTTKQGKYKNYPFRSYNFTTYQGGYSDHFPVYIYLIKEKN